MTLGTAVVDTNVCKLIDMVDVFSSNLNLNKERLHCH